MLTVSSPALIAQNALVPASEEVEEEEEVEVEEEEGEEEEVEVEEEEEEEVEEEEEGAEIIAPETAERGTAGEGEIGSEREGD